VVCGESSTGVIRSANILHLPHEKDSIRSRIALKKIAIAGTRQMNLLPARQLRWEQVLF